MTFEQAKRMAELVDVGRGLMVRPEAVTGYGPPFALALKECAYPNRLIAVSQNAESIRAAARLWMQEWIA